MVENTEQKLNIEKQILDLKRELKVVTSQVDDEKREYHSIRTSIEKNKSVLEDQKKYLAEVLNDISNAKLSWALEKDAEMQKIDAKMNEAKKIIEREKLIDEKEKKLISIQNKTTDDLNEMRRIELKVEAEKTAILAIQREIDRKEEDMNKKSVEVENTMQNFKNKLKDLISQFNG